MNIEELRSFCLDQKGTEESVKWEVHLCFCIADKMYAIAGLEDHPLSCSMKVDPEQYDELIARDCIIQAPYLAKGQWVKITDLTAVSSDELKNLILNSYRLVKSKLSKKAQAEL